MHVIITQVKLCFVSYSILDRAGRRKVEKVNHWKFVTAEDSKMNVVIIKKNDSFGFQC